MKVKLGSTSGIFEERIVEMTQEEIMLFLTSGNTLTVRFDEVNHLFSITN